MSRGRGASGLSGILLIDKPQGLTSHDVVNRVRRATGERRVGHAGTLDPMATGLLVVLIGPATRLEPYLSSATKRYRATITFGTATDTLDAEGAVTATANVADGLLDPGFAESLLAGFLGMLEQVPPAYSAIKSGGQTAHKVARGGGEIDLPPRSVEIFRADLLGMAQEPVSWDVDFTVSKGTYIRALARDIGQAAGTVAHLSALRRTASGALELESAHTLDDVAGASSGTDGVACVQELFTDPVAALNVPIAHADATDVTCGRALPLPADRGGMGTLWGITTGNSLHALYREESDRLVPAVVLATPIERRP